MFLKINTQPYTGPVQQLAVKVTVNETRIAAMLSWKSPKDINSSVIKVSNFCMLVSEDCSSDFTEGHRHLGLLILAFPTLSFAFHSYYWWHFERREYGGLSRRITLPLLLMQVWPQFRLHIGSHLNVAPFFTWFRMNGHNTCC